MKKPSRISKDPKLEEPIIPDRHFRHNEAETDYRMDELERRNDHEADPGVDEIRREQDDDE
jgi:hypothetical protein